MITIKKKILFGCTTLFLFISFIILSEILLRLFMPSLDNPFIREVQIDGLELYGVNTHYLKKYFPSGSPIIPGLKPTTFRRHKPVDVFRIVCLGESSMFGTPYQLAANISSLIRKQLRHLYPEKEFEVINVGAAAINTNVILDLSKIIVDYSPDLVLVYTGHNEFYGPEGVGASWIQKKFTKTIAWKYELQDLRIINLIDRYFLTPLSSSASSERNLMRLVSQKNAVPLNSESAERIFSLYESNLNDIVSIFAKRNVPIILSDVSSNLLFPPFMYDTSSQLLPFRSEFTLITKDYGKSDYNSALTRAQQLFTFDTTNAFVNFWIGKIYLAQNDLPKAKYFLTHARDEDLLKFRAPSRINEITKKVALQHGITIISSDSLFGSLAASAGIPDDRLFREHLHPNAFGYYKIATLFVQAILKNNLIMLNPQRPNDLLPFDMDSLSIPWLDLAYGDISIKQLTKQWPFQNYTPQLFVMTPSADSILRQIALDVYTQKIPLAEGCLKSAVRFQQLHQYRNALTTYASLIEDYPNNFYPYYLSGLVYKEIGDLKNAIRYYEASIQRNRNYLFSQIDLGLVQINSGKIDDAIAHLNTAQQLAEKEKSSPLIQASIYYGLSAAYTNKGDLNQAMVYIEQSIRLAPDYQAAQLLRNNLLRQK
ncbi:MAG: tetratricopeptide repeat protein [Bacteroidota bacterium]|nr:tetratricopeptide repeat protein [Bacteroidota bacterium]